MGGGVDGWEDEGATACTNSAGKVLYEVPVPLYHWDLQGWQEPRGSLPHDGRPPLPPHPDPGRPTHGPCPQAMVEWIAGARDLLRSRQFASSSLGSSCSSAIVGTAYYQEMPERLLEHISTAPP